MCAMKINSVRLSLRLGATVGLVWIAVAAAAADSSVVKLTLQNTGLDPDAAGVVLATLKSKVSTMSVKATGLTPGHNYTVQVGDIPEAILTADTLGKARATFRTPPRSGAAALDFDPRGLRVAVLDGTNSVLEGVFSGPGEPPAITVNERAQLKRMGDAGAATARYLASRSGARSFTVSLQKTTGTNWSLYVNGIFRGQFPARTSGGLLTFKSDPGTSSALLLDFDPRGQVLDVVQDTNLMFSGSMQAHIPNVNVASPSVQEAFIASTGADPDGTARARLRVEADARRVFAVELEDVPEGAYEFLADGVLQGSIEVSVHSGGTEGEIEFSSRPDDGGDELPLTFDPTNTTFTVQRTSVVYFQGTVTFASAGGTNDAPTLMEEPLTSTGLDPDASGDAKFEIDDQGRHKFSVEIENVAVGTYQLWVGGVQRGSISAQLSSNEVVGEIEFSNPRDTGELLLGFDPRGQLIEVKSAAGTFFSHLFGLPDTNSVVVLPLRIELPLFNTGFAPSASADMTFKRDDRGRRSFQIEIEDAPLGSYDLLVGGSQRASISVVATASGTHGEVEFEDEPDGGSLPLDFDPLGQDIALKHSGDIYFERTLPPEQ